MMHLSNDLSHVGHALSEALALVESDLERLEQHHGPAPTGDGTAGSVLQTLYGTSLLATCTREHLQWFSLAVGYASLGLDERAGHAMQMACLKPMDIPSAVNRMARPLTDATVRALQTLRDLDDFFRWDIEPLITAALAASYATFQPLPD